MSESYEDYEREYNACLSRIRSFLAASTKSRTTLQECERLLGQAKQHATAMQGLAEVEGNPMKIREASQKNRPGRPSPVPGSGQGPWQQ
mmetsp:Transcript_25683/g.57360  ORF Transcript_25683/g.57360 Transcript_25683/m.57360 type:complete len:89 (+) Transcript_25683:167-433(+)